MPDLYTLLKIHLSKLTTLTSVVITPEVVKGGKRKPEDFGAGMGGRRRVVGVVCVTLEINDPSLFINTII